MQVKREKFTYQLSIWVKDPKDLDFMRKQLAKGDIPCRIKRHTKNGKVALYRPEPTRYHSGQMAGSIQGVRA